MLHYAMKDFSLSISKLIAMCSNDIFIKTELINAYDICSDIKNTFNVFNSVDDNKKDIVFIGAMMKALVNNDYNEEALDVYNNNNNNNKLDDLFHVLAVKACINMNDINSFEKGKNIHKNIGIKQIMNNIQLSNIFIECIKHI